ncbi:unnamed protein product [Schistocephalus solidus]|uniref:Transmembrane protein n=1 Tax=Schistocephalus solidus TaxID=70667 RepID=A0A183TR20_SCHSO|nr:unnamed protein product [Schistocephalus solidus]
MDKNKIHLAVGLGFSVLFLILAVALSSWRCGTVLNSCLNWPDKESYQIVGALLVCAILVNLVALAIIIAGCITLRSWATPSALVLTWLGGILALAAIAYYFSKLDSTYCPLLAVIGMSFTLAMAITTSITMINVRRA